MTEAGRVALRACDKAATAVEATIFASFEPGDAAAGGFSARDAWQNDISGVGKLTKQGSGTLQLTGNNRFSGGVEVQAGTLEADSETALGTGDVYVSGGTLASNVSGTLRVPGRYTQLTNTTLELSTDARCTGRIEARGIRSGAHRRGGSCRARIGARRRPGGVHEPLIRLNTQRGPLSQLLFG
jgi:autotransporter-associated beta strand protein